MDGQLRMFRLAVEAINVMTHSEPGRGWVVSIRARRQGDSWDESYRADYDSLTSPEMADTVLAEIERELGL